MGRSYHSKLNGFSGAALAAAASRC